MNFHFPSLFRSKPSHTEVRYVAATKAESRSARALAISKRLELEIMDIHLTDDQRKLFRSRALYGRNAR